MAVDGIFAGTCLVLEDFWRVSEREYLRSANVDQKFFFPSEAYSVRYKVFLRCGVFVGGLAPISELAHVKFDQILL